jgi:hypothetical protein
MTHIPYDDDKYEVVDLTTDESAGTFAKLSDARGFIRLAKLSAYQIWRGYVSKGIYGEDREFVAEHRIECCDPYDGDDDRVRRALGEFIPSDLEDTESLDVSQFMQR